MNKQGRFFNCAGLGRQSGHGTPKPITKRITWTDVDYDLCDGCYANALAWLCSNRPKLELLNSRRGDMIITRVVGR